MKSSFVKFAFAALFLVSASFADDFEDALAAVDSAEAANMPGMYDINHFEYLDCWVESAANIVPRERNRISAIRDEAKVCGCYTVREKGGFGWRANDEGKKIVKVWDIPKPRILTCPRGMTCTDEFFIEQCVDHIKQSVPMLSDYAKGAPLEGAIALTFEDSANTKTPFGQYLETHKASADSGLDPLPELRRGDLLAVATTGAYNYAMASHYNRIPNAPIIMLSPKGTSVAVKRETLDQMIKNDV